MHVPRQGHDCGPGFRPRPRSRLRASANWRERNNGNAGQSKPHLTIFFSGSDRPAYGVLNQSPRSTGPGHVGSRKVPYQWAWGFGDTR